MLQAGVFLAEARAAFLKSDVTAMEIGALGFFAAASIIPWLTNLLPSFDPADGLEGVALDLPLPFRGGVRLGSALVVPRLGDFSQRLDRR